MNVTPLKYKVQISVSVPLELAVAIDAAAEREMLSRQAFLRRLLARELNVYPWIAKPDANGNDDN